MSNESSDNETEQERREKKLQKKRERIRQHGKSLAQIYLDAVWTRFSASTELPL